MAIADVLRVFRDLKREGTLQDYLVFGSVAAMVHTRPFFTMDVDIGVAIESDEEFRRIFNRLADFGKVEGHHHPFRTIPSPLPLVAAHFESPPWG